MKAYGVWVQDSDEGNTVIFAENRNEARKLAFYSGCSGDADYIDFRATRLPECDGLYKGESEGSWMDMDLREVLVKEYGWRCLEPDKDECKECGLCEEDE